MNPHKPLRVLLVDDDPDLLAMLEAVLVGPGMEIVGVAANGPDALKVAEVTAPDVAVVDYMMPGMDGFETATRLKALRPNCAVLIFSALDIEAQAAEHPAVDHFLKKSAIADLEDVLNRIGRGQEQGLTS